jgi:glucosylceramidase
MSRSLSLAVALVLGLCQCKTPAPAPAPLELVQAAPSENSRFREEHAPPASRIGTLVLTTAAAPFARSTSAPVTDTENPSVVVNPSQARHTIEGFGGAFNEHGWSALGVLSESERAAVVRALFDRETGLRFNHGRAPIGASDYALDRYSLDEVPGDYNMEKFSIERDEKLLIPFIRAALAVRPDLRLWASAWTPPTWMKTNGAFDSGAMKDDPKTYAAYALYLARYVESYRAAGIEVSMVVPQNEPGQLTKYPSCDWTPAQYNTFIADHLAPTFQRRGLHTQIYVGTINKADWDVLSVLSNPRTASVISGVALQWNALAQLGAVHEAFPRLPIMQSETECGNNRRMADYNPEKPPNDFAYAAYTFRKFRDFIAGGSSSYMLWNMVLDEHGKNIATDQQWPQNAAVVVNRATKRVVYTPMYWVTKHFSGLVDPGARVVESTGSYTDQIAFANPDGALVLELLNATKSATTLRVQVGAERHVVTLPPESAGTLLVPPG